MPKRSDFAQKLLDDLRIRKDRMAASSHDQRTNQSNHLPIDAYAYTKQTYRGPRNAKANEIVGSRSGQMVNRCSSNSSRRHRSVNNGELSNQIIIPYGKGGQSHSESQALAFAFENGGKRLRRADLSYSTNSIMGFLHQISTKRERGSNLDRQLPSTSSSHYAYPPPTSTTLSLVQINDISKGAQKLNHILRACSSNGLNMDTYSLQFAKELLQGAIDLEDSLRMLLLVDLQKSSDQFMITPQQQQAKNNNRITLLEEDNDDEDEEDDDRRMQRKMQLARPSFLFGNMMQRPITVTNYTKEAGKIKSNSSSGLADISKQKNQAACTGRIPNVIAKLMGLEDNLSLPEENKVKKKKDLSSNSKHTAKAKGSSGFTTTVLKNEQSDEDLVKKQDDHSNNSTNREQKGTVKGRTSDPPLLNLNTNMLKLEQQVLHERSQVKSSIQVVRETNASIIIQPEKGHNTLTNKHVSSNEKKSRDHQVGVQKSYPYVHSKNRPQEEQTLMMRRRMRAHDGGGSEMTMTPKNSSSKPSSPQKKHQPSINNLKTNHDLVKEETASNGINGYNVKRISSPRDREFERAKGRRHGIKTMKDDKHVHKLVLSKKIKQKVDPMLTARNGQGKNIPNLRDRASGKLHGGAVQEADAPINELQLPPTLYSSGGGGEFQSPQESANDLVHYQDVQSVAVNLQDQATPGAVDYGFKTGDGEVALRKTNGTREDGMGVNPSKLQDQTNFEISTQQPLTESENCLKWILVMSQLFVNTAEALFRLNIPFSVLQGGHQDNQDQVSKHTLDCGYEVMKRKGIRQELKVHNCSNIVKMIRSLDDLVRKLNEDMEKLIFYGRRKGTTQVDVEDYLPKMLVHDVYDKYPDINCMWDFGWNDETFAFIEKYDVIRDTEKHILSVLLDEITKDCCMFLFNEED